MHRILNYFGNLEAMGRWSYSGRLKADDLRRLSVGDLKRAGMLCGFYRGGSLTWENGFTGTKNSVGITVSYWDDTPCLTLNYTITRASGEKKDINYRVNLTTTACYFGGKRYWFICPLTSNGKYCGRRVSKLYLGEDYFGCRHCYNLTYNSRNENRKGKNFWLFHLLDMRFKLDDLEDKTKRRTYAGKLTKKQMRQWKMVDKMLPYASLLKE